MSRNRSAVVIGGASGIGAAIATRHKYSGDDVVVWDLHTGADIVCDIADPEQVEEATRATLRQIDPPDLVTISAGVGHHGLLRDVPAADWDRVVGVNAKGVWLAMRALAALPLASDGRSIIAISSVNSRLVDRAMGLYCASKAALDMIVRVAACEWAPDIRVNAIAPGVTETPMLGPVPRDGEWLTGVVGRTAMGRLGTPTDIAEAVFALHSMAWVTGQIIDCDGGLSLRSPIDAYAHLPPRPRRTAPAGGEAGS